MADRIRSWTPSTIFFAAFILLVPFEGELVRLRRLLLPLAAVCLWWEMRPPWPTGWKSILPFHKKEFAVGAANLAALVLVRLLAPLARPDEAAAGDLIWETVRRMGPFAMGLPFLAGVVRRQLAKNGDTEAKQRVPISLLWLLVSLWFWWMALAASYGFYYEESLKAFAREGGPYLLAYTILVVKASQHRDASRNWLRWLIGVGGLVAALAVLESIAIYSMPQVAIDWLSDNEIITAKWNANEDRVYRAQFPFGAHNRLASYLIVTAMLLTIASALGTSRRVRAALLACAAMAIIGIAGTGTRAALLALAAGYGIFSFARLRYFAIFTVAVLVIFAAAPRDLRVHLRTLFQRDAWTVLDGSVQYRVQAWKIAGSMIADRPVFGFGYGWKNYEELYPEYHARYNARQPTEATHFYEVKMPHAHNNLFEIGVETGLVGIAIFVTFQIALFAFAIHSLFRAKRGSPERQIALGIVALLVAVNLFGLTNYTLRRTVGFEVWMSWGIAHAFLVSLRRGDDLSS